MYSRFGGFGGLYVLGILIRKVFKYEHKNV